MKVTGANMIDGRCMPPVELGDRAEEFMKAHGEGVIVSTAGATNAQALLSYVLGRNSTYSARGINPNDGVVGAEHGVLFIPAEGDRR